MYTWLHEGNHETLKFNEQKYLNGLAIKGQCFFPKIKSTKIDVVKSEVNCIQEKFILTSLIENFVLCSDPSW